MKTLPSHHGWCRHCGRQRQQRVRRAWISVRAFWYAVLGIGLLAAVPALGSLSGNPFVTGLLTGLVSMPADWVPLDEALHATHDMKTVVALHLALNTPGVWRNQREGQDR